MTTRKTIGRQLNSQATVEDRGSADRIQFFMLSSGRKVKFTFRTIPAQDVSGKTYVRHETNGRDQSALTKESLKEIINTIKFQQFFACIGIESGDSIEILDGSRRRAAAILVHRPLDVMVTTEHLSVEEARKLAKAIQTAKEHNLREIGLRLLALKEGGLNQKEIAEQEGLSQAKVTRAIQAATVPQELVSLFPVQSELSVADYKNLSEIAQRLEDKQISYQSLFARISATVDSIIAETQLQPDEQKVAIVKAISRCVTSLTSGPQKDKPVVSDLWAFNEKDKFARKRIKGRSFSYEFSRLSKEVQQELDEAISGVLQKHLSA